MKENNVRSTIKNRSSLAFLTTCIEFPSQPITESFNYGCIYKHLITTWILEENAYADGLHDHENEIQEGKENVSDYSTSKPLRRGKTYFDSGHVKNMADALTVQESYYFAKATVLASYKIEKQYPVNVMLHSKTGDVLDAKCQCKASAVSLCSHVAALLYALLDFVIRSFPGEQ